MSEQRPSSGKRSLNVTGSASFSQTGGPLQAAPPAQSLLELQLRVLSLAQVALRVNRIWFALQVPPDSPSFEQVGDTSSEHTLTVTQSKSSTLQSTPPPELPVRQATTSAPPGSAEPTVSIPAHSVSLSAQPPAEATFWQFWACAGSHAARSATRPPGRPWRFVPWLSLPVGLLLSYQHCNARGKPKTRAARRTC